SSPSSPSSGSSGSSGSSTTVESSSPDPCFFLNSSSNFCTSSSSVSPSTSNVSSSLETPYCFSSSSNFNFLSSPSSTYLLRLDSVLLNLSIASIIFPSANQRFFASAKSLISSLDPRIPTSIGSYVIGSTPNQLTPLKGHFSKSKTFSLASCES